MTGRSCPECGTGYRPSEYDFTPNSVAFCCPHCDQPYYGTDERGHLDPPQFVCVTCQQETHMDQMVLRPTEGVDEKRTKVDANPWLLRQETGKLKAWWRTVGKSLFASGPLIAALPGRATTRDAWNFALTHAVIVNLLGWPLIFIFSMAFASMAMGGGGMISGKILLIALSSWVIPVVGTFLLIGLWSLAIHGMLKFLPGRKKKWGDTFQCLCYSSSVLILGAVPCLGVYIGWIGLIFWPRVAFLMLRERHEISTWHAMLATLWLPLLFLGGVFMSIGYLYMAVLTEL